MDGAGSELRSLGIEQIVGASGDSPLVQAAFAHKIELGYPLLSDYNWEAARALGILWDEFVGYRPMNTRAGFLVDRDAVLRYAWISDDPPGSMPHPKDFLEAARGIEWA